MKFAMFKISDDNMIYFRLFVLQSRLIIRFVDWLIMVMVIIYYGHYDHMLGIMVKQSGTSVKNGIRFTRDIHA